MSVTKYQGKAESLMSNERLLSCRSSHFVVRVRGQLVSLPDHSEQSFKNRQTSLVMTGSRNKERPQTAGVSYSLYHGHADHSFTTQEQ